MTTTEPIAYMYRHPGHLIRRAHQIHDSLWATLVSREVTPTQFSVLTVVAARPRIDQVALSREASLDTSTAGVVVDRLVKRGWIAVGNDVRDRRRKLLTLTQSGSELCERLSRPAEMMTAKLVGGLDVDEREGLVDALIKLVEHGENTE